MIRCIRDLIYALSSEVVARVIVIVSNEFTVFGVIFMCYRVAVI